MHMADALVAPGVAGVLVLFRMQPVFIMIGKFAGGFFRLCFQKSVMKNN